MEISNLRFNPNPVVNDVKCSFWCASDRYADCGTDSLNGQVLQSKQMKANRLTNIQFNLTRKYASGAYFMRVRNAETGTQAVTRLFIQ
jgi:hypothetical protein